VKNGSARILAKPSGASRTLHRVIAPACN